MTQKSRALNTLPVKPLAIRPCLQFCKRILTSFTPHRRWGRERISQDSAGGHSLTSFSSGCNLKIYVHEATREYQHENTRRDTSRWAATHTPSPTRVLWTPKISPLNLIFTKNGIDSTNLERGSIICIVLCKVLGRYKSLSKRFYLWEAAK